MNPTPVVEKTLNWCDCRDDDPRGTTTSFYERDADGWIVCSECGTVPHELSARPIPSDVRVELSVYCELDAVTARVFECVLYAEEDQ